MEDHTFTSVLWRWEAQDAWRFVTVPAEVTVGATTWRTSVFPATSRGAFVLPVKKAVRHAEDLDDGDDVTVTLRVLAG